MAITNFVPDVWSANILSNLSVASVAKAITNTDYQGDASQGDSVKITSFTDPAISAYTAHSNLTVEDVDDASQALLLNQFQSFAFEVDDLEKAQSVDGGKVLSTQLQRAAYGLANVLDAYVLTAMGTGASASAPDHQIAEATISTASDAYDAMVDWSVLLDESDVPEQDRFVVVTPGFYGKVLKDSRFIAAGDSAGSVARANGRVGQAAGFEVFKSNNLPDGPGAGAGKSMIAGSRSATTLAEQVRSVEAARMELRFADLVKGLHVYGAKVTRDSSLVSADIIIS
tara:strand:+ start:518 stop:1372 length:855 start_codon:yes stop_codon:yes gene_type:complete